jgi:hypothetical protein
MNNPSMERSSRSSRAVPLLMGLLVSGCSLEQPPTTPEPETPLYVEGTGKTTSLTGFAWDPEAFWFSVATCGGEACPIPPLLAVGIPHYERALIGGASVSVFDPMQGAPAASATGPTAVDGSWFVSGVPSRGEVPYFTFGVDGSIPLEGPDGFGGGFLPPIPATPGYLPTLALQPIFTDRSTACFFQQSPQLGSTGILEAVAKYRSAHGKPTTVEDFLDPSKIGGTVVWWSYMPGNPVMRIPAFGAGLEVGHPELPAPDGTQVLAIGWAPPDAAEGDLPPGVTKALQSKRGFYVAGESESTENGVAVPATDLGLAVVVLPPPAGEEPYTVSLTVPHPDLQFGPIFTPVPPGIISFVGTQIFPKAGPTDEGPPPDADVTPAWLCLPPE